MVVASFSDFFDRRKIRIPERANLEDLIVPYPKKAVVYLPLSEKPSQLPIILKRIFVYEEIS